jgi:hypothetical protein
MIGQTDAELQEENRLAEQREETILQMKRERAQRLAIKRGLSETFTQQERPRSAGQGLREVIPLRRGRSSTLQSQSSDVVPLRGRSSTLGSQSSGQHSPRVEERSQPTTPLRSQYGSQTQLDAIPLRPRSSTVGSQSSGVSSHLREANQLSESYLSEEIPHQRNQPPSEPSNASSVDSPNESKTTNPTTPENTDELEFEDFVVADLANVA